ncbi:hypothetical protein Aduo_007967 [Ancylostoma duodenale]
MGTCWLLNGLNSSRNLGLLLPDFSLGEFSLTYAAVLLFVDVTVLLFSSCPAVVPYNYPVQLDIKHPSFSHPDTNHPNVVSCHPVISFSQYRAVILFVLVVPSYPGSTVLPFHLLCILVLTIVAWQYRNAILLVLVLTIVARQYRNAILLVLVLNIVARQYCNAILLVLVLIIVTRQYRNAIVLALVLTIVARQYPALLSPDTSWS